MQSWLARHATVAVDWRTVSAAGQAHDAALVRQWTSRLGQLQATQRGLVQSGRWRGGPRTLLAALELQYRELPMTAGLAWLLRPDGHHGLGAAVLSGLLSHVGLDDSHVGPVVRVALEEQREGTRADLVVYGGTWTIVVEAKIFAVEQDRQLDRLYMHWREEPDPRFVFLTRGSRTGTTAVDSRGHWREITWQQVADIARATMTPMTGVAPGVHDYIATLEAHYRV